jgi:hypothetical protein
MQENKMKPHPALAVPLVNAGRRQNLTTEHTEEKYFKYSKNSVNSVVRTKMKN